MDETKKRCPSSFARNPKAAHKELKDAMTMRVVGVIFHGNPDRAHLFLAAPQVAGNSNLNCECMVRAIVAQFAERGMLP
eukprot:127606-Pleurochrysis_carterae.AAC.1